MALNGAVYNVTQYMDFHPGGWEELVKGVGRDATDMFNEVQYLYFICILKYF